MEGCSARLIMRGECIADVLALNVWFCVFFGPGNRCVVGRGIGWHFGIA